MRTLDTQVSAYAHFNFTKLVQWCAYAAIQQKMHMQHILGEILTICVQNILQNTLLILCLTLLR